VSTAKSHLQKLGVANKTDQLLDLGAGLDVKYKHINSLGGGTHGRSRELHKQKEFFFCINKQFSPSDNFAKIQSKLPWHFGNYDFDLRF
jgi:hypothetical protein